MECLTSSVKVVRVVVLQAMTMTFSIVVIVVRTENTIVVELMEDAKAVVDHWETLEIVENQVPLQLEVEKQATKIRHSVVTWEVAKVAEIFSIVTMKLLLEELARPVVTQGKAVNLDQQIGNHLTVNLDHAKDLRVATGVAAKVPRMLNDVLVTLTKMVLEKLRMTDVKEALEMTIIALETEEEEKTPMIHPVKDLDPEEVLGMILNGLNWTPERGQATPVIHANADLMMMTII